MIVIAKAYLYLLGFVFFAIGFTSLFMPEAIAARFDLLPQSSKGIAEIRAIYGGGILAWALITVGALRGKRWSPGLLIALAIIMGAIATGRVASLILDHETTLSIPAGIAEALIVLACWIIYKHDQAA